MIELTFGVLIGIEDAVVNQPKLIGCGVKIDTVDYPDAFANTMSIAAVLPTHEFNFMTMLFVEHRIVKENVAIGIELELMANLLPDLAGGYPTSFEKVLYVIVGDTLEVIR
jgi:hypothetical protein